MSQAERYTHLAALTGRENNLDSAYHAPGYPLMEQDCNALHIATGRMKVEIRQDENDQPDMPASAQGDGDEWER